MDCDLVLCLLLGEDIFSALHIFHVGSPLLEKHSWPLFGIHLPEWWIWEKRQPPFTRGLESVSLLQIAHILWSLYYRVVRWGAGLQVVSTAGNWKSQCLVYSRSRPAVITDLSYVPGICFIRENVHHLSDFWVYLSVGYKPGKGWMVFFFFFGHIVCGILVPQPGIEPVSSTLEAWSPNHWMAREVPGVSL